jgi:hypothetical protein
MPPKMRKRWMHREAVALREMYGSGSGSSGSSSSSSSVASSSVAENQAQSIEGMGSGANRGGDGMDVDSQGKLYFVPWLVLKFLNRSSDPRVPSRPRPSTQIQARARAPIRTPIPIRKRPTANEDRYGAAAFTGVDQEERGKREEGVAVVVGRRVGGVCGSSAGVYV